ncbi:MAG: hypothetical protein JXO48_11245 [Deltaproteobacteria bacterium]|nr:hypothetical protein [Deltaproteobacteria bacterium]
MNGLAKIHGFTLIETLTGMALGIIVIGALYAVFIAENRSYNLQENIIEMQQNARSAMDIMAREIRMAGYDPLGTANAGIQEACDCRIRFTQDITGINSVDAPDGDTGDANEQITYGIYTSCDGIRKLGRKSQNGSYQPVAEHIDTLTFEYFDQDGNTTTVLSNIRRIRLTLTIQCDESDPRYIHPVYHDHFRRYTLQTTVQPRNLNLQDRKVKGL